MTRYRRLALMPTVAVLVSVMLAGASGVAQDDAGPSFEPMASMAPMAPMASIAPMASMAPGLSVSGAWARESMMSELAGAAYMVIHNSTGFDDALVGASSPIAAAAEIHQTSMADDGTMAMAQVAEVPVPAGGDALLEPGGYHIMLVDLIAPLEVGQQFELSLEFSAAAPLTISVPVQALGPKDGADDAGAADKEVAEPELTWAPLVTLPPIAAPPIASPVELAHGFTLGIAGAPVAIEVWEDFQCPFCQRFTLQIEPALVAEYVATGKASLTFRQLPFLGDESHWAAVAASLAAEQDRFWPFHDYLFANLLGENVGSYDLERLLTMGEAAGLDMARYKAGLTLDRARQRFAEIEAEARQDASALGITATPTVTVNGVPLESPDFDTVAAAVEAALASAAGSPEPEASPEGS